MTIKVTIPNTSNDSLTFGSANTPTAAQVVGIDSGSSNGQLAFNTTASGTSTERVRIDVSGNVGIGTSSPSAKLQVSGAGSTYISVTSSNAGTGSGLFTSNATSSYYIGAGAASGGSSLEFRDNTNSTTRMIIDSSGNLLVGTTLTPSTSGIGIGFQPGLSTSGVSMACRTNTASNNDHVYFYTPSGLAGYIRTNGTTTTYASVSDARLKENIVDAPSAIQKVEQMQVRSFDWKSSEGHVDYGFIAQELNLVAPQAVAEGTEKNDVWAVDTSLLVPILTKAIQEQQALITTLTERITALEAK